MTNHSSLVLIGFGEALAAPEVAFNLTEAGFRVAVFIRRNSRPPVLRKIKGVKVYEITAPENDWYQAVSDLNALYQSLAAAAIMPLNDRGLWLVQQLAECSEINIAGAKGTQAEFALDKRTQIQVAQSVGFYVPQTITLNSAADAEQINSFPVILKPALAVAAAGRGLQEKERLSFCGSREELSSAISSWKGTQPLLAQNVKSGTGAALFGFAAPDMVHCWSAHMRVRMMNPKGSGSSACKAQPVYNYPLKQAEAMIMEIGWKGPFMIELLRDHAGKYWFIELNGRPWGSMALALRMGFEYPLWSVRQTLDPNYTPLQPSLRVPVTCRHLGRELIHILQVIRGPSSTAIPNWPSIWKTLFNVLRIGRNDRWYNWRSYNKSVFIMDTFNTIMDETIRKFLRK